MKICPIAIAVGCPKCPAFKICPAKASLGGYVEAAKQAADPKAGAARKERLVPLEVLDLALVLLRRGEGGKRAEVAALARLRVHLARVEAVTAGFEFADHADWAIGAPASSEPKHGAQGTM